MMNLVETYTVDFIVSEALKANKPARLMFEVAMKRPSADTSKAVDSEAQSRSSNPNVNKKLPNGWSNTIYSVANGAPSTGLIIPDDVIAASFRDTSGATTVISPMYWVILNYQSTLSNPDYDNYSIGDVSSVEARTIR